MNAFVCYPSEHLAEAKKFAGFLKSVDVDYWFDKESLVGGDEWDRERKKALADSDMVIVICSTQTTERDGVYQREINETLERQKDMRLGKNFLIPVRAKDIDLPPELSKFQYIDIFSEAWEIQAARAINKSFEQNGKKPPPQLAVAGTKTAEGGISNEEINIDTKSNAFFAQFALFEETDDYWRYINSEIRKTIYGAYYNREKWDVDGDISSAAISHYINVTEFYRKDEIVSLTISESIDGGGAHPINSSETLNFLGRKAGRCTLQDLFPDYLEVRDYLKGYVNLEMNRQMEHEFDISTYEDEEDYYSPDILSSFNLNDKGIRIYLSSHLGFPHVLSGADIYVPWESLEEHLHPVPRKLIIG